MRDFRAVLARLQALRTKFENLLDSARRKAAPAGVAPARPPTRLREVTRFGTNPGKLRMFAYAPQHLPPGAPLVIALHGCTQTADEYDYGTGWSSLADELGFAVIYPQQQPGNNPRNCFSWFLPEHAARGKGEAHSITQMVEHAIATFAADRGRVFVTGLSAGGAMAAVMLATYPEVFAGGAIIAGLPYGCASNVQQAFELMFTAQGHGAQGDGAQGDGAQGDGARTLGDRVRAASRHRGAWPKISVWHGSSDPIVQPANAEAIIRQWTDVHSLAACPSYQEQVEGHMRRVWCDADGQALVEAFAISGMAHGVPLDTTGRDGCGAAGAFFLDVGISSTHHIARFWRLHESLVEMPRIASSRPTAIQFPAEGRGFVLIGAPAAASPHFAERSQDQTPPTQDPMDPNAIIAAAFRAAGLPIPEIPAAPPGGRPRVESAPIIAAALKAARRLSS